MREGLTLHSDWRQTWAIDVHIELGAVPDWALWHSRSGRVIRPDRAHIKFEQSAYSGGPVLRAASITGPVLRKNGELGKVRADQVFYDLSKVPDWLDGLICELHRELPHKVAETGGED